MYETAGKDMNAKYRETARRPGDEDRSAINSQQYFQICRPDKAPSGELPDGASSGLRIALFRNARLPAVNVTSTRISGGSIAAHLSLTHFDCRIHAVQALCGNLPPTRADQLIIHSQPTHAVAADDDAQ